MCRMVGIIARRPLPVGYELVEAPRSLLWLSRNGQQPYTGRTGTHPDGWGLAWREGEEMKLTKRGTPAGEDPEFVRHAQGLETDLLIAHVRKASPGLKVCLENAHPFSYQGLCLAHNGDIDSLPGDAGTDSERLLRWLAPQWDRSQPGLLRLLQAARAFRHTSLSFLMSEGSTLYALRQVRERPRFLAYYTLYLKRTEEKTVVASEPLDDSPEWQAVDNATLLIIEAGGEITRLKL